MWRVTPEGEEMYGKIYMAEDADFVYIRCLDHGQLAVFSAAAPDRLEADLAVVLHLLREHRDHPLFRDRVERLRAQLIEALEQTNFPSGELVQ